MRDFADARTVVRAPFRAPASGSQEVEAIRRRLRRLALDVHDGAIQSLVAVGYGLMDLRERLLATSAEPFVAEQVAEMLDELTTAEQQLRQLITSLEGTDAGNRETLDVIAEREVTRFRRLCAARCELDVSGDLGADSHSQEIALRSVLHEALTNIAKHAGAENVTVRLLANESVIVLEVEDDGYGFDPGAVGTDRIGLSSMRERMQLLGGSLTIQSRHNGPTRVIATLPRWQLGS